MSQMKLHTNEKQRIQTIQRYIYSTKKYAPTFPSCTLAFNSGAVGNIVFQSSCIGFSAIRHYFKPKEIPINKSVSFINIVYAGIVTASYLFYVKSLHCGDFSFVIDLRKRYLGGIGAGVTAVTFQSIAEHIRDLIKKVPNTTLKQTWSLYKYRLFTAAPLVMMQQAHYDNLRMLEDAYFRPSPLLFFVTGAITGFNAQLLVQPLINIYEACQHHVKITHFSGLWKNFVRSSYRTIPLMAISLTVRDSVMGRLSKEDYAFRCERREMVNKYLENKDNDIDI